MLITALFLIIVSSAFLGCATLEVWKGESYSWPLLIVSGLNVLYWTAYIISKLPN